MLRAAVLLLIALAAACSDGGPRERNPITFQSATASLTHSAGSGGPISLQPARDDTIFFGPTNIDESEPSLEFMMRSQDNSVWLQLNLLRVEGPGKFDDFHSDWGDGRITVLLGAICDGGMGKLIDDDCAWYSSDFFPADCQVELTRISDDSLSGTLACRGLGANCTPDSDGQREPSGVCQDRLRRSLLTTSASFELKMPVDPLSGASRSPRSLLR